MSGGVVFRRVVGDEWRVAARLVFDPPGPEATGIAGGEAGARRLGLALFAAGLHPDPQDETWAAFDGGRAVGVLVLTEQPIVRGLAQLPALVSAIVRSIPPTRLPGLLWRGWLRGRLDFPIPSGSLHVMEIHVAPSHRGQGIGGALLDCAECVAGERGLRSLSLTTHMGNPARRLYERAGYRVTSERCVSGYEAVTGAAGRVLMEKALVGSEASSAAAG